MTDGGVMVMGYDMFRLLACGKGIRHKQTKLKFAELLLAPGTRLSALYRVFHNC